MTGEVEPLHALEDGGAQVVLHVERESAADEPTDVREHEVDRAEADEQHEQWPQRLRSASTITLSTTDRSMSGMATVMSVVPSDTPNAMNTLRL